MENLSKYSKLFVIGCTGIVFLLISCNNKNLNDSSFNTGKYKMELQEFPSFLVDFFPDSVSNIYSIEKNIDITNECIYYINYVFKLKSEDLKTITDENQKKIKTSFTSSDSSLVVIKRVNLRSGYEQIHITNGEKLYPIPYFESADLSYIGVKSEDIYSDATHCGLTEDFVIYVLDSQPGNYWEGLKPLDYMPKGWKNGYSKGFCINEKIGTVIYWGIIW